LGARAADNIWCGNTNRQTSRKIASRKLHSILPEAGLLCRPFSCLAVHAGRETGCVSTDSLALSKLISQRFRLTTQTAIPRSLTLADPHYSRTAQIYDAMV